MASQIEGKLKSQLDKYLEKMTKKEMGIYLQVFQQEKKRRKHKKKKK